MSQTRKQFFAFSGDEVWNYDVTTTKVTDMPRTKYEHDSGSAVCYKQQVYVISGQRNKLEMLDLNDEGGWVELSPPKVMREGASSALCDASFFTTGGGLLFMDPEKSGEHYDIGADSWSPIADMNEKRYGHGSAYDRGLLYVIGGLSRGSGGEALNLSSVECFDPREGCWRSTTSMNSSREDAATVVLNGQIYALGSIHNFDYDVIHMERYDPRTKSWIDLAATSVERERPCACMMDGKIYVAGGECKGGKECPIEVYDPIGNSWETAADVPAFDLVDLIAAF